MMKNNLVSRSRPQRQTGRPAVSTQGLFPRAASQVATLPDPPQRATPPAAFALPASAITRFPALGRSHTPPVALIGSLPHPPEASGHSIGQSEMPVKWLRKRRTQGYCPGSSTQVTSAIGARGGKPSEKEIKLNQLLNSRKMFLYTHPEAFAGGGCWRTGKTSQERRERKKTTPRLADS